MSAKKNIDYETNAEGDKIGYVLVRSTWNSRIGKKEPEFYISWDYGWTFFSFESTVYASKTEVAKKVEQIKKRLPRKYDLHVYRVIGGRREPEPFDMFADMMEEIV